MIIIDQSAESKLTLTLERLRAEGGFARGVYFKLSLLRAVIDVEAARTLILKEAVNWMSASDTQVFLCEDGDIFILAPTLNIKGGRQLVFTVAKQLGVAEDESWVVLSEMPFNINKWLVAIEEKIQQRQQRIEDEKKRKEESHALRKREAILDTDTIPSGEAIHARRALRETPELMIIEDDAFSRRLVEKVLAKKFSLTGLGDAVKALATYARLAPDILFLDINLPDVSGHELLEKIMRIDPDAYVIMLSGNADKDNIMQAMKLGAKGFIAKPFTREKLQQYIERCPTISPHHKEF